MKPPLEERRWTPRRKAAERRSATCRRPQTRTDKLQAAHERLQQAVQSIIFGADWQRMLKGASKFHKYSFNNHLMIFLQRPNATLVAGQELGRDVHMGEKGIAILARELWIRHI